MNSTNLGGASGRQQFSRGGRGGKRGKQKSSPFRQELRKLMFGCGDDKDGPNEGSLDLLETYAEEFITNLVVQASRRSQRHGSNSLRLGDILHAIKKD